MTSDDDRGTDREERSELDPPAESDQGDDTGLFDRTRPSDDKSEAGRNQAADPPQTETDQDFTSRSTASSSAGDDVDASGVTSRIESVVTTTLSIGGRSVLNTYLPAIFVGFLLLTAAGGVLIHGAQTAPEATTETQTVGMWSTNGTFTHGAVVTNGTFTFTEGQRLENRPLYFTRVSPTLTGDYVLTHRGDAEQASGTVDMRLVLEAIDEDGGAGDGGDTEPVVYWRQTQPIETVEIESLTPGETRSVSFEADVGDLTDRVAAIEETLGASPGTTRIAVVAETTLEAQVVDDRFVDTRTDRLALEPGQGTYSVSSSLTESQTYEATETVEVPAGPTPLQQYGGPILTIVGLLGAIATAGAWRADLFAVSETEETQLTYSQARSDLDKWISVGSVPPRQDRTVVELSSLRDLVNVAIDSDRRVIERPDATPRYVVLDDDVRYVFDPPAAALGQQTTESSSTTTVDSSDGDVPPEDHPRTPSGTDSAGGE